MASSRIFVSGLPPTVSEKDFQKHFEAKGRVTDVRLIPNRRIGFIGFRSGEEATKAVKYFNRSYIRMSKIRVELATPIADASRPSTTETRNVTREGPQRVTAPAAKPKADQPVDSRKRKRNEVDEADPKLQEFLEVMRPNQVRKRERDADNPAIEQQNDDPTEALLADADNESDVEYQDLAEPRRPDSDDRSNRLEDGVEEDMRQLPGTQAKEGIAEELDGDDTLHDTHVAASTALGADVPDDEWLRQRKSRLLDLVDQDDPSPAAHGRPPDREATEASPTKSGEDTRPEEAPPAAEAMEGHGPKSQGPSAVEMIQKTCRLFLRNLSYSSTEDEIRDHFMTFGPVKEVHLSKGYAFVLYERADSAVSAFQQMDGAIFQGRILHVLPASGRKTHELDDFALAGLPLKKRQLIQKRAQAATNGFQWNSLFMNPDAIISSVADRLGVSKAELLDPTSSDAAVKQALAETSVIKETKEYFASNGVNLDAFKSQKRADTTILVKNFAYGTSIPELRKLFEEHGPVLRVLMPPSGTIAIVQYAQATHAKAAFGKLAYRRLKDSVLFLEKGPKDLFTEQISAQVTADRSTGIQKLSAAELLEREADLDSLETTSLFIRNLNFATTSEKLEATFKPLEGFVSARVTRRADPKKPGQLLSVGYGFAEFRTKENANAAISAMDGYVLDDHALAVKPSQKGLDAAEERRRDDRAKKLAAQKSKLVIRNVPFEATRKDIRSLFGKYGELRSVRLPRKFGNKTRGFAFAEFSTPREAENCYNALRDTHLLGRRLVLEWAEAEAVDAEEEIEKMQKKIGGQFNKMSLQLLTGPGRRKVNIGDNEDEEEA